MGCCGGLTSSATGIQPVAAIPPEGLGQRYMQSGENPECWAGRTQTTDDKGGAAPPEAKIITASVAAACDLSFKQSIDALPPKDGSTTSWDAPVWKPQPKGNITWTASENNGKFTGSFAKEDENVDFQLKITAHFSDGKEDTKTYNLKPVTCNPEDDAISFCNPHPRGTQSAPFGEVRPAAGGGTRAHKGLDFANGGAGGPIVAAADGKVLNINSSNVGGGAGFSGYGYWVLIQHSTKSGKPMCNTFYAHLASICVNKDQTVAKGQTIGQCGGSGAGGMNSYPIHLHFEMHIGGLAKDPAPYISPAVKHQVGSDSKPLWKGDVTAPGGSSANYGAAPAVGKTTRGPDGYQTNPDPNENKGKAVNQGTVDTAGKQCEGTSEPPLNPNETTPGNDPPCVDFLTLEQLQKAMPTCGNNCNTYLPHINRMLKEYVIDDLTDKCGPEARKRAAMILAQMSHESGDLRYKRETWGPTSAQMKYDASGAGNNGVPGSGKMYRGGGSLQLVGRANYAEFGKHCGLDLVTDPDLIHRDPYTYIRVAGWFWKTRKMNSVAGDIQGATKKIYGNDLAKREVAWTKSKSALQVT